MPEQLTRQPAGTRSGSVVPAIGQAGIVLVAFALYTWLASLVDAPRVHPDEVRYLIAAEGVKGNARKLRLTDEQISELRERKATYESEAESALLKLYAEVWLPRAEAGGIVIDKVTPGGRPLQTMLRDQKHAMIHERIVELITQTHKKVFDKVVDGVASIADKIKVGPGLDPTTEMGPLVSDEQFARVTSYIASGRQEGAEIVDVDALGLGQRSIGLGVRIDGLHLDREAQFLRRLVGDLDDVRIGPADLDQLDVLDVLGRLLG